MSFHSLLKKVLLLFMISLNLIENKDTFSSCDRYTSFGYGYRDFFEVHGGNHSPNQVFYLEFYVKTDSDAHILLKNQVTGDDGFEIVIGGGSNTFSQIRLLGKEAKNTMITQKTENILSGINYQRFWVSLDRLGVLSVGNKEDDVFVNWRFDNPFTVKYFSFGSWNNMKADWRFGCKEQSDIDIAKDFENLTPLKKLKNDLFSFYDPNVLPVESDKTLEVKVNFQIGNVQLNEKRGELTMFGYGDLKWSDSKMKWVPENYNGINIIYVPAFQIWTPTIRVLNTLMIDQMSLFDLTKTGVTVKYDGTIYWRPPFKSVSSCTVDLKYWPFDIHNCSVYIGFWMEPTNLVLKMMDEYETLHEYRTASEWEVLEAMPFNSDYEFEYENYGILYVELRRTQGAQMTLLLVPYVVAVVMSLSSFWVSPYTSSKLHLGCGSLIILILTLFLMGFYVPAMTESVPRLVKLYSWSTVVACTPIIVFVFLKILQTSIRVPESVSKLLQHNFLNSIFCLPELPQNLIEYSNVNEEEESKIQYEHLNALQLVSMIERIFFYGYLITLIIVYIII